jgi:hypothetical protein
MTIIAASFNDSDGNIEIRVFDLVPRPDITAYEVMLIIQQILEPDLEWLGKHPEVMRHFIEK